MSAVRWAILLSALALSACADHAPDAVGRAPGADPIAAVGSGASASMPPAAGRVVAVRRRAYANGFTQEIVMEGPLAMAGENRITLQELTTSGGVGRYGEGDELKIGPPTDHDVETEMEAQIPGVAMRFAGAGERDRLGPFGYAVGAAGRLTCVYAWQYVTPARPLSLIEGATGTGALPVALRVRLCRDLPAAVLVGYLRDLDLGGDAPVLASADTRSASTSDALAAAVGTEAAPATLSPDAARVVRRSTSGDEPRRHGRPHVTARWQARRVDGVRRSATRPHLAVSREMASPATPRLPTPDDILRSQPVPTRSSTTLPSTPRPAVDTADSLPMPR